MQAFSKGIPFGNVTDLVIDLDASSKHFRRETAILNLAEVFPGIPPLGSAAATEEEVAAQRSGAGLDLQSEDD